MIVIPLGNTTATYSPAYTQGSYGSAPYTSAAGGGVSSILSSVGGLAPPGWALGYGYWSSDARQALTDLLNSYLADEGGQGQSKISEFVRAMASGDWTKAGGAQGFLNSLGASKTGMISGVSGLGSTVGYRLPITGQTGTTSTGSTAKTGTNNLIDSDILSQLNFTLPNTAAYVNAGLKPPK